ncbi:MAG TPA: glycosyltransferase, partial [Mycobacteriales bacterium]|nr:glycosyltransferase [Mycobacteriales bacterium]
MLRLSGSGSDLLDDVLAGRARGRAADVLAARLVRDGIVQPVRPTRDVEDAMTVVVPVRDDADGLDRCLAALRGLPVIVVDDGSADAAAIGATADKHGVPVVWHALSRGPGAARNTGVAQVTTPLVAFVDADARISADALRTLARWFTDPHIAAVAPRIRAASAAPTVLHRFLSARSPLDLGPDAALVRPRGRVGYVPTTVLLCRRSALQSGFDEELRYGEDVDLVWRITDAGHQVRYDPGVVAHHREPATWRAALMRRHRYGTSAG